MFRVTVIWKNIMRQFPQKRGFLNGFRVDNCDFSVQKIFSKKVINFYARKVKGYQNTFLFKKS